MNRTLRPALLLILTGTIEACAHGSGVRVAAGSANVPPSIQLSTYAGLLRSVTVTVANATHQFIFDTGGGETVVTPEIASSIGCVPYGRAIGFRAGGQQVAFEYCDNVLLQLGAVPIAHGRVGVFDFKGLLPPGAPRVDGFVSLQSFRDQPVTIDFAHGKVTLETRNTLAVRTKAMRPVMIRVATGPTGAETAVYVAARIGGRRVWFLLDSGNGDPLLVAPHVARMAGLPGNDGDVSVDVDSLGAIRLSARTTQMISDGVLGAAFMQEWVFTLDLRSSRMWMTPVASPRP